MNIDELKLLLEAIQGISGDVKTAVVWWFAIKFLTALIHYLTVVGVALCVASVLKRLILSVNTADSSMHQINEMLNQPAKTSYLSHSREYAQVVSAVSALKAKV